MTAGEKTALVLTYEELDAVSNKAVAYMAAIWLLRPSMPEAQWLDMVTYALAAVLAQAEAMGRLYGAVAVPVDGDRIYPELPSKPYRPVPEGFTQRTTQAPAPESTITEERIQEITEHIDKAVKTLAREIKRPASSTLETPVDTERVDRMVKDETVSAMQRGHQDGVRLRGSASGYRRGINPDACELCFWLWKEGFVYEIDQPMHRHTGCRCVPVPTNDPPGRYKRDESDEVGQALLDRYYSETLRETSFRRDTEAQEAPK